MMYMYVGIHEDMYMMYTYIHIIYIHMYPPPDMMYTYRGIHEDIYIGIDKDIYMSYVSLSIPIYMS